MKCKQWCLLLRALTEHCRPAHWEASYCKSVWHAKLQESLVHAPGKGAFVNVLHTCLQVRFLDPEVAYWQTATQHYMVNGSGTNVPSAVNVHALDGTR